MVPYNKKKTMKVSLRKIRAADAVLKEISDLDLDAAPAFKIADLVMAAAPRMQAFEAQFAKHLQKYGRAIKGKPGAFDVPQAKVADFLKQVDPLLDTEIEINVEQVSLSELPPTIKPRLLMPLLGWFVVKDTQPA